MASQKHIWVSHNHNNGWRIHPSGETKYDTISTQSKEESIEKARKICIEQDKALQEGANKYFNGNLELYKKLCRDSYGRDPFPPRG